MAFLYYLLVIYTAINTPQVHDGHEKLFTILLDGNFIYYTMLLITVITLHSGVTYIIKNRHIILRLFRFET